MATFFVFHNIVAFKGDYGSGQVRISDKVAATQKKAKREYRKKEERRKEKGLQREIRGWVTWGK